MITYHWLKITKLGIQAAEHRRVKTAQNYGYINTYMYIYFKVYTNNNTCFLGWKCVLYILQSHIMRCLCQLRQAFAKAFLHWRYRSDLGVQNHLVKWVELTMQCIRLANRFVTLPGWWLLFSETWRARNRRETDITEDEAEVFIHWKENPLMLEDLIPVTSRSKRMDVLLEIVYAPIWLWMGPMFFILRTKVT